MHEIRFGNHKDIIFKIMMDKLEFYEKQCILLETGIFYMGVVSSYANKIH